MKKQAKSPRLQTASLMQLATSRLLNDGGQRMAISISVSHPVSLPRLCSLLTSMETMARTPGQKFKKLTALIPLQ